MPIPACGDDVGLTAESTCVTDLAEGVLEEHGGGRAVLGIVLVSKEQRVSLRVLVDVHVPHSDGLKQKM